ncbi:hypothetical protein BGW41_002912 [Actinomortierella wolfii]|nr:hypothetical protein BGW41_002912 [Actinomortierella wolfii]
MKHYRPTASEYELVCKRFNFMAPDITILALPNDNCAAVSLFTSSVDVTRNDVSRMYVVHESKNRVEAVIPTQRLPIYRLTAPNMVEDVGVIARVDYLDNKCITPTTSIFGTQDELVNGMQASVDNTTLTTLPAVDLEELTIIEAKVVDTEVAALVCVWSRYSIAEVPHIQCAYTVTNVFIIKPLPMSPDITRRLANKGLNPTWTNITTITDFTHVPRVSSNTVLFNIPKILDESAKATRYFATLGNNIIIDWEGSMLCHL